MGVYSVTLGGIKQTASSFSLSIAEMDLERMVAGSISVCGFKTNAGGHSLVGVIMGH